jgi:hypothetical protein
MDHERIAYFEQLGSCKMARSNTHIADGPTSVALIPCAVEFFGDGSELHDEIALEVLRLGFPALLPPQPKQRRFIVTHDDPGVRAADERSAVHIIVTFSSDLTMDWAKQGLRQLRPVWRRMP